MRPASAIINSDAVTLWTTSQLRVPNDFFGPHSNIGIVRDGRPIVGAIFNNYQEKEHGNSIHISVVSSGAPWATKDVLKLAFAYAFDQLECVRITAAIKEGNEPAIRLAKRLGFRKEGVIRKEYDGKSNAIIFGLLRSECRWI